LDQDSTLQGDVGAYRVYESIASGGFGSVYIGRDTSHNVPVAVKRLHPHLKDQPGFVERFEREASTVRGLIHPNVVRVIDQGRDSQGVPFIVLEWVEGLTVGDWLKRRGPYAPAEAADIACQALEGLQAAWTRRVVHRDVKPANLMVTPTGRVKVMDFGVAKDVDLATLVGTSGIIGTPAYMAPEQLRGMQLDTRADVYALGVTLYQMIAGSPPFQGPTMADFFRQHLQEEPPPLPGLNPGIAAILDRALAKMPEDRFATPGEMLQALRPYASEVGIATSWTAHGPQPLTPSGVPHSSTPHSYPPIPTPQPSYAVPHIGETEFVGNTARATRVPTQKRVVPLNFVLLSAAGAVVVAAVVAGVLLFGRGSTTPPVSGPTATPPQPTAPTGSGAILLQDPLDDIAKSRFQKNTLEPASYSVLFQSDSYVIQRVNPSPGPPVTVPVPASSAPYDNAVLAVDARLKDPSPNQFVTLVCRDPVVIRRTEPGTSWRHGRRRAW
jgi:eukaryotic-like serine/threonine-protein kinase